MVLIRLSQVNKIYGTGKEERVQALLDVNFQVDKGEFISIIGASGSGKSTLLHAVGGVDRIDSGSIMVEGENITMLKEKQLSLYRRRKIGFVFQFYNLIPVLTVEENIRLPLMLDGLEPEVSWLKELLESLGLADRRNSLPSKLSGGQQQRAAIARALIHRPAVLLADEPTGNLDSKNGREIVSLLKTAVNQLGQTLLLVTHDPSVAGQANRIFVMEDGNLKEQ